MADKADLKLTSPEDVAFKLMEKVARLESESNDEDFQKPDVRTYYLTLYNQCIKAGIYHYSGSEIFEGRRKQPRQPGSSSHQSY